MTIIHYLNPLKILTIGPQSNQYFTISADQSSCVLAKQKEKVYIFEICPKKIQMLTEKSLQKVGRKLHHVCLLDFLAAFQIEQISHGYINLPFSHIVFLFFVCNSICLLFFQLIYLFVLQHAHNPHLFLSASHPHSLCLSDSPHSSCLSACPCTATLTNSRCHLLGF